MCYVNASTYTIVYIPHLSGVALVNDTAAPTINITIPSNGSTIADGQFTFNFDVWEANPASTFCRYNLTNGTGTYSTATFTVANATSNTGTYYTFSSSVNSLLSRNYNLSINCSDGNNANAVRYHTVTVSDSQPPNLTSVTYTKTSTTATITWTTSEYANSTLKYGTDNPPASETSE